MPPVQLASFWLPEFYAQPSLAHSTSSIPVSNFSNYLCVLDPEPEFDRREAMRAVMDTLQSCGGEEQDVPEV